VFLEADLENDLKALARRRGQPLAMVVREGLTRYVAQQRRQGLAPSLSFVGIGRSGRRDIADRHEDVLWREPHTEPPARPKRSAKKRRR
jgi:hypothetical protein